MNLSESDAHPALPDSSMFYAAASKSELRRHYQQLRIDMTATAYQQAVASILQRLQHLPEIDRARRIHAFWPIAKKKEIDLRPLLTRLHNQGKQIVLPVVLSFDDWKPETPRLQHRLFSGAGNLVPNNWGVFEPQDTPLVTVDSLDLILVPALAADKRGFRLGYGKGYYDEFLSGCNGTTVCPLFSNALTERLPTSSHDIPVDYIVTENDVIRLP